MQLTNEQISLYESISGVKIDLSKSNPDKDKYWVIDKNNNGRFRSSQDILNYTDYKFHKNFNSNQTSLHVNTNNNVEFIKGNKTRRLCINLTLNMSEFNKLKDLGKQNSISWSNVATQIIKSYIKNLGK